MDESPRAEETGGNLRKRRLQRVLQGFEICEGIAGDTTNFLCVLRSLCLARQYTSAAVHSWTSPRLAHLKLRMRQHISLTKRHHRPRCPVSNSMRFLSALRRHLAMYKLKNWSVRHRHRRLKQSVVALQHYRPRVRFAANKS